MEPLRVDKPLRVDSSVEEFWTNFVEEFCTLRFSVSRVFFLLWRQSELLSRQPYIMRKFLHIQIQNRPGNTKVIEFPLESTGMVWLVQQSDKE